MDPGQRSLLPVAFFAVALVVSSLGPGSISTVALIVPLAIAMGREAKVPPFLTALMVANGANAGNLSPISTVGIIANSKMAEAGLGGHELKVWFANFAAHSAVALLAHLGLGGHRLAGFGDRTSARAAPALTRAQRLTIAVVAGPGSRVS